MKLILNKNKLSQNPAVWLRKAGYSYSSNRQGGDDSFARRLGGSSYPRFHIYINQESDNIIFNLHLDQKQPSYKGSHAHNAEYDGEVVEAEIERLKSLIFNF